MASVYIIIIIDIFKFYGLFPDSGVGVSNPISSPRDGSLLNIDVK